MASLSFTVLGIAAPQGSKVRTKWGGMRESNKRTMPWRQEVAACAQQAMSERGLSVMLGPVRLSVQFVFPRPKSHYRTGKHAGILKDDASKHMTSKPDVDKLVRAIGDAMTGIIYRDDAQVFDLSATKSYVGLTGPCTTIIVDEMK